MKQVKVSNPQHQKLLDRVTGWKEVALVVIFILLAAAAVLWSIKK